MGDGDAPKSDAITAVNGARQGLILPPLLYLNFFTQNTHYLIGIALGVIDFGERVMGATNRTRATCALESN